MGESGIVTRELIVPLDPSRWSGPAVRIVHVSDLHFGKWNGVYARAQKILSSLDYDLLAVTGDFASFRRRWRQAVELTRRFFEPPVERAPIFGVLGNHDDPRIAAADLPITFLRDDRRQVRIGGASMSVVGLEQTKRDFSRLASLLNGDEHPGPTILLSHYPSTVFHIPTGSVDLVLSGHTHGGQIRLPWLGCLWANDRIPRRMSRGLHRVNGAAIHVSPGIGVSLPIRVRVNCPPEITVLTLQAAPAAVRETHTPAQTIAPEELAV